MSGLNIFSSFSCIKNCGANCQEKFKLTRKSKRSHIVSKSLKSLILEHKSEIFLVSFKTLCKVMIFQLPGMYAVGLTSSKRSISLSNPAKTVGAVDWVSPRSSKS